MVMRKKSNPRKPLSLPPPIVVLTPKKGDKVTEEQRAFVSKMSSFGISQAQIALCLDISVDTLYRHFGKELKLATANANAIVAGRLFATAIGNSPQALTAMIFWLKTRGGWRESRGGDPPEDEAPPPDQQVLSAERKKLQDDSIAHITARLGQMQASTVTVERTTVTTDRVTVDKKSRGGS